MNYINAVVTEIKSVDNINIVHFEADGQRLTMMSLELDSTVSVGTKVVLGAKATSIALATGLNTDLSISNQLKMRIESVNNGQILSSVKLQFADAHIESIITQNSSSRMALEQGKEVIALIKASELSIAGLR